MDNTLTIEQKVDEFYKFKTATKIQVNVGSWIFPVCWDLSITCEGLRFKTENHSKHKFDEFDRQPIDLLPVAHKSIALIHFKTFDKLEIK